MVACGPRSVVHPAVLFPGTFVADLPVGHFVAHGELAAHDLALLTPVELAVRASVDLVQEECEPDTHQEADADCGQHLRSPRIDELIYERNAPSIPYTIDTCQCQGVGRASVWGLTPEKVEVP